MELTVAMYAVAFNALLWLGRVSLAPLFTARWGGVAGWSVTLLAPVALLAMLVRVQSRRLPALVFVSAASLALVAIASGLAP